jgi:hypothetical protein
VANYTHTFTYKWPVKSGVYAPPQTGAPSDETSAVDIPLVIGKRWNKHTTGTAVEQNHCATSAVLDNPQLTAIKLLNAIAIAI